MTKATATKSNAFAVLMMEKQIEAKNAEKKRRELETQLDAVQKEEDNALKFMRRLDRIKEVAGWARPFAQWYLRDTHEACSYQKTAWSRVYEFNTALLEFTIIIKERTDLKRYKYEVSVSGEKTTLEKYSWKGGYTDHDYLKEKYGTSRYDNKIYKTVYDMPEGYALEQKFTSEEAAMEFVATWQTRLVADHAEVIGFERELADAVVKL